MSPHECCLTHINIIKKLTPEVWTTTLKGHVGHAASGATGANHTRPLSSGTKPYCAALTERSDDFVSAGFQAGRFLIGSAQRSKVEAGAMPTQGLIKRSRADGVNNVSEGCI